MLHPIAPEFSNKQCNYYRQLKKHLENDDLPVVMFAYKEQWFGCLSHAAAVLVFLLPHLRLFLEDNPNITNRLACIVRNFLTVKYFKPVLVVFAVLGIQLVEPFYCHTVLSSGIMKSPSLMTSSLYFLAISTTASTTSKP